MILRRGLECAGIASVDEDGPSRDFSSIRYKFGTDLARANAPPRVAQTPMRHSMITLTMDRHSPVGA